MGLILGLSFTTLGFVHERKLSVTNNPTTRTTSIAILPLFILIKMEKRLNSFWPLDNIRYKSL